jgi:hypothetical protein
MDAKRKAQRARIKAYSKARAEFNLKVMRYPGFWKKIKEKNPEKLGQAIKVAKWSKEILVNK